MRTIGIITTTVAALVALLVALVGLRSLPDVRRYLRIRAM